MPLLYLAKVNLNSNIFDVYDKKLKFDDVFDLIYKNIADGTDYFTQKNRNTIHSSHIQKSPIPHTDNNALPSTGTPSSHKSSYPHQTRQWSLHQNHPHCPRSHT